MKAIFTVIGIALLICVVTAFGFTAFSLYIPTPRPLDGSLLYIETGASLKTIAGDLKRHKFIHSETVFVWHMRLHGLAQKIRAGEYSIPQRATMLDIIAQITDPVSSGSPSDVSITIIEGWDNEDVIAELQRQGLPSDGLAALNAALKRDREVSQSITFDGKPADAELIGYLYPDTYFFKKNATAEDIVDKIFDHFESYLTSERIELIEDSSLSFYEILTVASIVEKEVSSYEDRRVVAGIFLQRLADRYPLQSDATVNFVTKKNTTRPSYDDTVIDSAYNTYKYAGLPPTPISNPSISAIDAVLHPVITDHYFFLTTPEGQTVFSDTYQEHLRATRQHYGN